MGSVVVVVLFSVLLLIRINCIFGNGLSDVIECNWVGVVCRMVVCVRFVCRVLCFILLLRIRLVW